MEFRGAGAATLAAALACSWSLWARYDNSPATAGFPAELRLPATPATASDDFQPNPPEFGPTLKEAATEYPRWEEEVEAVAWTVDGDAEAPALPVGLEAEPFHWPEPPEYETGPPLPGLLEEPVLTPYFLRQVLVATSPSPVLEFMNGLLGAPELMLDTAADMALQWIPRPDPERWSGDDRPVVFRMLDLRVDTRREPFFTGFLNAWILREQSFFGGLAEWDMDLVAYGEATGELDLEYLERRQTKILWDTLRRTYLSKYQLEGREAVRKDGFGISEWRTIDYVVIPPAAAAYVYYRGFDQRITAGSFRLNLGVEPISEWIGFKRDFVGGVTVELMVKGCPVGLVAAFGVTDGDFNMDFIGIGTGIDIALKALARRQDQSYTDVNR